MRGTLDVDDGAGNRVYKFYTSTTGRTWTQLGATVTTAGTTSIFDGTRIVTIGADSAGTGSLAAGKCYAAQVRASIDGAAVANFDPRRYTGGTTFTAPTGEVWTLNGAASILAGPA